MISLDALTDLVEADRRDVLSVTLDVDPTKPEHQTANPAYLIWLREEIHRLLEGLPDAGRREVKTTAQHVLAHVEGVRPRGRGLVIFAAPNLWRDQALPFPIPNRVQYGRPDLMPVLWAASEHKAYAILVVDREHARIAVAFLGKAVVVDEEELSLDTSDWRFKSGRPATYARRAGRGVGRGAEHDTFEARVDEHVHKFWQEVSQAAAHLLEERHIDRVIIGGPDEAAAHVREMLPEAARAKVAGVIPIPAHATPAEIYERTLPLALADHHRREFELLSGLLERCAGQGGAVVGRVATLEALMRGQVATVVASRDLDGDVYECARCAYVTGLPEDTCRACGGPVERTTLRQAVPRLARRHGARLELVGPAAHPALSQGIGALLRYPAQTGVPRGQRTPGGDA